MTSSGGRYFRPPVLPAGGIHHSAVASTSRFWALPCVGLGEMRSGRTMVGQDPEDDRDHGAGARVVEANGGEVINGAGGARENRRGIFEIWTTGEPDETEWSELCIVGE